MAQTEPHPPKTHVCLRGWINCVTPIENKMATALTGNSSPSPLPLKLESGSPNTSDVAQFISKVWSIVNDHSYSDLVSWSEVSSVCLLTTPTCHAPLQSGKTFVVLNKVDFSKHVLPHYFKHNNFESFVRQLNLCKFVWVGGVFNESFQTGFEKSPNRITGLY